MRAIGFYVLLLIVVWTGIFWMRVDEDAIPARTETPTPRVVVHDLTVPATGSQLGFVAGEARPMSGSGPVTLGGVVQGLQLWAVRLDLDEGLRLSAPRGSFVDGRLSLEGGVTIHRGDVRVMEAGRVEVVGEQFRFGGVVLIHTAQGSSRDDQLVATRAELSSRLK